MALKNWVSRKSENGKGNDFLEIFLANKPLLVRLIGQFVKPNDIEDILQETFLLSYTASKQGDIHNPRAYFSTAARNIAINHIRRAESRLNVSFDDLIKDDETAEYLNLSSVNKVENEFESEEEFLTLCRAVKTLPPKCRRVFILKKIYGLSLKEIAKELSVTEKAVEKHVTKGFALTLQYMSRHGYASKGIGKKANGQVKR
ncbi:MAG: RNA polymerase subunit sigma-70 [Gammaproteobacteria bacterium]|nr:RNA polymerase subunit sigma-70 [Gammaproteobacteria bacterium]|tara:strand:- start:570 stop:1175 length:606 start_codon:yes stop_codon:yes gene_type:complete